MMALTKHKRELLQRKETVGAEFAIDKQDITYIVAQGWPNSFARIENNKKAIAEQGWGPLNFNCLLHPEIVSTQYQGGLGCGKRSSRGHQDDKDDIIIAVTPIICSLRPDFVEPQDGTTVPNLLCITGIGYWLSY
jgi:hypothetical protein